MPKVLYEDLFWGFRVTENPSGPGEPEIIGLEFADPECGPPKWDRMVEMKRDAVADLIKVLADSLR